MTTPQPSVKEIQQRLAAELSGGSRIFYTLLLLFDLFVACAVGSLWLTEPGLPLRTSFAFGGIVIGALMWAAVLGWSLTRRKVLLAKHKVVTGRLASFMTALFMVGALALAGTTPSLREVGLAAGASGAVLLGVAIYIWRSAARRFRQLLDRTRTLERELASNA